MKKTLITFFIALFIFSIASYANAGTVTWTGSGSASNSVNWSGGVVPQNGDDVIFNYSSVADCTWDISPLLSTFNSIDGYTGTVTLNSDLTVTGDITVNIGILSGSSSTITLGGDWNFFTGTSTPMGDMDGNGIVELSDVADITLMAMDLMPVQFCSDLNTDGKINILDSVLTLRVVNGLDAQQACTGGMFLSGTSTVILNGIGQTIYGDNIFYNLNKTVSSADTLYFEAWRTQTILNSLTLQGGQDYLLGLRSTVDGEPWYLDAQGTRNTSYVDMKDLYNLNFTNIVVTNSVDSGNNNGVSFGGSECVCLGKDLLIAQIIVTDWRQQ